ncbi:hypothetical protein HDU76_005192 [Blyttiomyces sp. JEL0837]|nr:hypothetical protein HDU76_005192 [Blyttiomyces sp. JEL0837]
MTIDITTTGLKITAISSLGLWCGAALYISSIEAPARLRLPNGIRAGRDQFKAVLPATIRLQSRLIILSTLSTAALSYTTKHRTWLLPTTLTVSITAMTLAFIIPINKRLLGNHGEEDELANKKMLERWNGLHAVRTGMGCVAFLVALLIGEGVM